MRRIAAGMLSTLAALIVLGAPAAHAADTTRATISWSAEADVDLHVYDDHGHHAFYGNPPAIPEASVSGDMTTAGSETFTDQQDPSSRPFGYSVCLFNGADVPVAMTWTDEHGTSHEEAFTLAASGDCRNFGTVSLIAPDSDADGIVDASDNCPNDPNYDQADSNGNGVGDACEAPPPDSTAPVVTLDQPADGATTSDATPTISGSSGTEPGDSEEVDVSVYAGSAATGDPVQLVAANGAGGQWSVDADSLGNGHYTVEATQSDASGNVGRSETHTFTVAAPVVTPTPTPTPSPTPAPSPSPTPVPQQQIEGTQTAGPAPVLRQSVVAGAVSGTVKVKGKDGNFHVLGADESIPLGSTVDATKGKVLITAASGPGGATQSGFFYQGAFVVTQTAGSKPITQLALAGALECGAKGKASSARKRRRVRRLWGDGHGRFRTKGRSGAATVRGTKWLTQDTCAGTLVRVKRGVVAVRDFGRKKTVTVKKGHSYLARAKRP